MANFTVEGYTTRSKEASWATDFRCGMWQRSRMNSPQNLELQSPKKGKPPSPCLTRSHDNMPVLLDTRTDKRSSNTRYTTVKRQIRGVLACLLAYLPDAAECSVRTVFSREIRAYTIVILIGWLDGCYCTCSGCLE